MKKIILVLIFALALTGCVSRIDKPVETPLESTENIKDETSTETVQEDQNTHALEDPAEISEAISIVTDLLNKAKECNLIYTGDVATDENAPTQTTDGASLYYYVDSKYKSINDIENLWTTTFIPDGKARAAYEKMNEAKLYGSFNGELYIKEHDELPPMTMGEWDLDSIIIKTVEDDQIIVEMDTSLVGQPNGRRSLALFNIDGQWILSDSYFLD